MTEKKFNEITNKYAEKIQFKKFDEDTGEASIILAKGYINMGLNYYSDYFSTENRYVLDCVLEECVFIKDSEEYIKLLNARKIIDDLKNKYRK